MDGAVPSSFLSQYQGVRPLDDAAWKADGSPSAWQVYDPTLTAGKSALRQKIRLSAKPGNKFGNNTNAGPVVFDLVGRDVTTKEVMGLPSDEASLRARLLRGYAGHDTESDTPASRDAWMFQVTLGVLRDMPVSPATRAAAYRILTPLHGIRPLGQVKDPLGRTGQGVGMPVAGLEQQIIVDPKTGSLLTDQKPAPLPQIPTEQEPAPPKTAS